MYDKDDPRSALATATAKADSGDAIATSQYYDFGRLAPESGSSADDRTSAVRGQNVVVIHTFAHDGDELDNGELVGELAIILTDQSPGIDVVTDDGVTRVDGAALVIVPPGRSHLAVRGDGPIVRLVESTEKAWAARLDNPDAYAEDHPRVALLERWPEPTGDVKVRVYALADVPDEPGRFGRIFRTRSFMVNFLPENDGPRDPHKLSPHTHDDFEQLSLAMQGEYIHHIRTPWMADRTVWRDDEHVTIGSPSVAVIAPPTVHTSEAHAAGVNQLIDIFSPPRVDFSEKPGWVLNADDYPMP